MSTMKQALDAMSAGDTLAQQALEYAQGAYGIATFTLTDHSRSTAYKRLFQPLDPQASLEAFRQQIDARCWMHLLSLTGMESMMDRTAKEELYRDLCGTVPALTEDNVWSTLEGLASNASLIFSRGLAKAFVGLDRRFRSHDGFKIGSRVVLTHVFNEWGGWAYGSMMRETLRDIERVFRVLDKDRPPPEIGSDGKPIEKPDLLEQIEIDRGRGHSPRQSVTEGEYFRVRGFQNGNAHLWFTRDDLVEKANQVLADYYGAVLPDGVPADVTDRDIRSRSTALCKDLSFYATPPDVIRRMLDDVTFDPDDSYVLEPSAGDGQIVRALLKRTGVRVHAIEVDPGRVSILQGIESDNRFRMTVAHANFLQIVPREVYTHVVMNPPFFGTHYMQHVMHAFEFLKPGGVLVSVLPATAELGETKAHKAFQEWVTKHSDYRHRIFQDLPMESFASSGTRVSTVFIKLRKRG